MFNSTSSIFLRGINPCTWTWADQFIAWWKLLPLATQTSHQSSKTIAHCNLQDLSRLVVKALGQQVLQEDNRLYIIYILRSEHATILSIKLDRIEKYREGFPKCFPKNCAFGRHSIGAVLRCASLCSGVNFVLEDLTCADAPLRVVPFSHRDTSDPPDLMSESKATTCND